MTKKTSSARAGSQTIGPFFHNGLKWDQGNRSIFATGNEGITLFGTVTDGEGTPVGDAMLEFFVGDKTGGISSEMGADGRNVGFVRTQTGPEGIYRLHISGPPPNGSMHVMLFARGLLTHLYTRVYFAASANDVVGDPAFDAAHRAGRSHTLLATSPAKNAWQWNVRLQGDDETVFFERG